MQEKLNYGQDVLRNVVKCLLAVGKLDRILSAMDEKKSLNSFEIISGLEETDPFIFSEVGTNASL